MCHLVREGCASARMQIACRHHGTFQSRKLKRDFRIAIASTLKKKSRGMVWDICQFKLRKQPAFSASGQGTGNPGSQSCWKLAGRQSEKYALPQEARTNHGGVAGTLSAAAKSRLNIHSKGNQPHGRCDWTGGTSTNSFAGSATQLCQTKSQIAQHEVRGPGSLPGADPAQPCLLRHRTEKLCC